MHDSLKKKFCSEPKGNALTIATGATVLSWEPRTVLFNSPHSASTSSDSLAASVAEWDQVAWPLYIAGDIESVFCLRNSSCGGVLVQFDGLHSFYIADSPTEPPAGPVGVPKVYQGRRSQCCYPTPSEQREHSKFPYLPCGHPPYPEVVTFFTSDVLIFL